MKSGSRTLLQRAIDLLSRREYSRRELSRHLADHAEQLDELEKLLDQLARDGYQSDERFAQSFMRSRVSRGQGPVRIIQELKQRGVSSPLIELAMAENRVDWFELAAREYQKRFSNHEIGSPKERAKRIRFLLYRGFNHDQVSYALEQDDDKGS